MSEIDKINNHLNRSTGRYITLKNLDTGKLIEDRIFKTDIENLAGTVEDYLKQIVSKGFENLQVLFRLKSGNVWKSEGGLKISMQLKDDNANNNNTPMQNNAIPTQTNYPQTGYPQNLGTPGVYPSISERTREDILDLKEKLQEVKEERNEYKSKFRKSKARLEEVELKLKYADKEKEYALMDFERNKKSFLETEIGKEVATGLTGLLGSFAGIKQESGQPAAIALNGAAKYSEMKTNLLSYIQGDAVSDVVCEKILLTIIGMTTKGDLFISEHQGLLDNHNLKN